MIFYALLLICSVSALPLQRLQSALPLQRLQFLKTELSAEVLCEIEDGVCCVPECGSHGACNENGQTSCEDAGGCEWICTQNDPTGSVPGPVLDTVDQPPSGGDNTGPVSGDILDSCGNQYTVHAQICGLTDAALVEKKSSGFAEGGDIDWDLLRSKNASYSNIPKEHMSLLQNLDVIGPDGRWRVSNWTYPYYKNVYIFFDTGSGYATCSGSLISPRHVLTAGHCVSDAAGNYYVEWYCYPAYNAGLGTETGWIGHHHVWVADRWHHGGDWQFDVAVITLDIDNTGRGWFAFGWDDSVDSNTWFDVDGYPGDQTDAAGDRILVTQTMQMDYSVQTDLYETETGDIVGGNSGGPGWISTAKNDSMVNAVVSYACCGPPPYDDFNGLVRITEEKYDAICDYIQSFDETKTHCTPQSVEKTVTHTQTTTTTTTTATSVTLKNKL